MFRCNECGCEYKEKPVFCDCGNDTFSEIYETISEENTKTLINIDKLELLSKLIFALCLVLSILVLMFFPKIDTQTQDNTPTKPATIVKTTNPDIPDINTFWIDSKPLVEEQKPVEIIPVEQIKEIFKPKPMQTKPKTQQKQVQTKKQEPKQQTSKPVQTPTQNTKPKPIQTKQQTKPVQTENNSSVSTKPSNAYEFINYKNALRQRLLSNLSVSAVQGSGDCGIEFAVNTDGKLINRAFTYQSENKSVNDEVYKMLMRTPTFNPPPSSYKGQKIKMVFKFNNGNFSISFTQ